MADLFFCLGGFCFWGRGVLMFFISGQHRTIPALRLKHRSGSCGTASALPKCSIMSGCGTRIVLRGQKPLALCDRCPLLQFAVSATGGAHLCSIQYYLRFWLGICRTSLAVSALRIMRYCPYHLQQTLQITCRGRCSPSSHPPGPAISPTAKTRKSLSPSHLRALL